jgi:four helix bundle protein
MGSRINCVEPPFQYPSNIAEGQARFSQKEFHHFLSLARGSLVEIETQLLIARDLKYR